MKYDKGGLIKVTPHLSALCNLWLLMFYVAFIDFFKTYNYNVWFINSEVRATWMPDQKATDRNFPDSILTTVAVEERSKIIWWPDAFINSCQLINTHIIFLFFPAYCHTGLQLLLVRLLYMQVFHSPENIGLDLSEILVSFKNVQHLHW